MNPFTESTVARPLAGRQASWHRSGSRSDHRSLHSLSPDKVRAQAPSGSPAPEHDAGPDNDAVTHSGPSGHARRSVGACLPSGASCRSWRGVLVFTLCLASSAVSGVLTKPVVLAGATVIAGMAMPRPVGAVDLNKASVQELQALNGIGPKTAAMIVDERTRGGNFSSLSDLSDRVRGIGPKKAAALQAAGLEVTGPAKTAEPAAASSRFGRAARR